MPKKELTHKFIQSLQPPEKPISYYDRGESGLILHLSKAGSKTFSYRYNFDGIDRRYTIGKFPAISLSGARRKLKSLKLEIGNGYDPQKQKNERRYQPETTTFGKLVNEYKRHHLPTLRESTRAEYNRIIERELLPKLRGQRVNEITPNRLSRILSRKKKDGSPTMANRIRAVLSSMFDYGKTDAEIDLSENPVEDTPRYSTGENKRERYYEVEEIRILWKWFEAFEEPIQSVFKMLLITGQRKTETMRMRWDDIQQVKKNDFKGMVWKIPAKDAKNKKEHEVPLSDMALQVIETMRPITGGSDFVFESPRKDNEPIKWIKASAKKIKDDKEKGISDFRPHDLRRTVATYMADNGISPMIIGKVLNHKGLAMENTITARYNRASYLEQKQEALNRWSYKLDSVLSEGEAEAKITRIA